MKLWDIEGKLLLNKTAHQGGVLSVDISKSGENFITGSWDITVKIWRIDGTEIKTINAIDNGINIVKYSHNGKLIASSGEDGIIKLWDQNGDLIKTFIDNKIITTIFSLDFSPDNEMIISGDSNKNINVWSIGGSAESR